MRRLRVDQRVDDEARVEQNIFRQNEQRIF
jgi:hypothetical protein